MLQQLGRAAAVSILLQQGPQLDAHILLPHPIQAPDPDTFEEQIEIAQKLNEKIGAINEILESKEQFLENLIAYKRIMYYEYVTGKKEVPEF